MTLCYFYRCTENQQKRNDGCHKRYFKLIGFSNDFLDCRIGTLNNGILRIPNAISYEEITITFGANEVSLNHEEELALPLLFYFI